MDSLLGRPPAIVARHEPGTAPIYRSPPTSCRATDDSAAGPRRSGPRRSTRSGAGPAYLGTSHRQATVRFMVSRLRNGLGRAVRPARRLRDAARQRRHHRVLGRRHVRAHRAAQPAPQSSASSRRSSPSAPSRPRTSSEPVDARRATAAPHPTPVRRGGRRPVRAHPQRDLDRRRHDARRGRPGADDGALVAVDATSAAGGLRFDAAETDVYYFAPQKCLAIRRRPVAGRGVARRHRAHRAHRRPSDRWMPASLDLGIALENSRKDQTYNTPALATVFLAVQQVEWINEQRRPRVGGGRVATGRPRPSTAWAEALGRTPRRSSADPADRSHVVATIDLDDRIDANACRGVLRRNGIVDTESYRKLGPQPAAHRPVPGHRARRRRRAHPLHRPRDRRARLRTLSCWPGDWSRYASVTWR